TEARRIGLVHRVVPRESLLPEAERVAVDLASRDPAALAAVKLAIARGMDLPLAASLDLEKRLLAKLLMSGLATQ
ncbi:MAG: enoyl-CoA hydratase-related protein, partial [Chloroflexi bacterium]|nr:enoyl-CoA hydratase-related protein [Chloroflexota bacterium]